jgi:hypothetical protein
MIKNLADEDKITEDDLLNVRPSTVMSKKIISKMYNMILKDHRLLAETMGISDGASHLGRR